MSDSKRKRVLLMDDEEMIRDVVSEQLSFLGYEAETARNGEEAIKMYKNAKESNNPFDLIILDLTVAEGMDGKETVKQIRRIDPYIPIVVSTGYSYDDVVINYKEFGFSGVLTKPFKMDELKKIIEDLTNP